MRNFAAYTISVLVALPIGTGQAAAFELFGRCIVGPCETEAERDAASFIDPLRYNADMSINGDDEVDKAVRAASELWRGRDDAVGGSAGLIARAQADYTRMQAALYNQGHYGGSISILLDGRQASDLQVGDTLSDTPQISIQVDAGAPYLFGQAVIDNQAPATTERGDEVEPVSSVGFAGEQLAKAGTVKRAELLAVEAWRQQGYALADVQDRQVTARHPDNRLDVSIAVEPGPLSSYGDVEVIGTEHMDPAFTARQTGLIPGQQYDPDDIERALQRIERLGVFSVRRIDNAEAVDENGQLPLTLTVEERKLRRIGVGATFSNFDGFGAETYWLHRNLFGQAERLRLDASVGGVGSAETLDELTYNLGAAFTKPGVFNPDLDFNAQLYARRDTDDDGLTETLGGATSTLTYFFSNELTLEAGGFTETSRFQNDAAAVDKRFSVFGAIGKASFDNRDNKLDPTTGLYLSVDARPFYESEFDNEGFRVEAEARTYVSLDAEDRFILAGRIALGSVVGPPADETPDNMLFRAGGGGSVRGFGFDDIAITLPDGTSRGGQSKIELSAELRTKFGSNLGAVAFVDAASVSDGALFENADDWKVGAGVGVRYNTGLGPLRFDVGVPLNGDDDAPDFGVYAGIGQAF
ncbi:MAG: autotransporter assembly complex family protein [Ahrensia sp.]